MIKRILICVFFFPILLFAKEYKVNTIPDPQKRDALSFVSNPDGILKKETVDELNQILNSLEEDTKAEVAVVVVGSIGSAEIKDFAVRLFEKWGIGKSKSDNGFLILFVLDQRKITFETGYGLEGVLPDAICKRIQTQKMLPEFKKGDYDTGFIEGVNTVASIIRGKSNVLVEKKKDKKTIFVVVLAVYILVLSLYCFMINDSVRYTKKELKYNNYEEQLKSLNKDISIIKNIFVLFLPLLFLLVFLFINPIWSLFALPIPLLSIPGYVYGRFQVKKISNRFFKCDVCGGYMSYILDKNKYLTKSQLYEDSIYSVKYVVFVCSSCDCKHIQEYNTSNLYTLCSYCNTKAYKEYSRVKILKPTKTKEGIERVTYKCRFCDFTKIIERRIPRLTDSSKNYKSRNSTTKNEYSVLNPVFERNSDINVSSSESSSSSSSSSGSWGGGRSGGGGATSGW